MPHLIVFYNILCYSDTNASDEIEIATSYNKLSYFVWHITKHNIMIIGEDMNTHKGKDENNKFC